VAVSFRAAGTRLAGDKDVELAIGKQTGIEVAGSPYVVSLISATRELGKSSSSTCSDAIQGTFLDFHVVAGGQ
jgi:hypothetical protein